LRSNRRRSRTRSHINMCRHMRPWMPSQAHRRVGASKIGAESWNKTGDEVPCPLRFTTPACPASLVSEAAYPTFPIRHTTPHLWFASPGPTVTRVGLPRTPIAAETSSIRRMRFSPCTLDHGRARRRCAPDFKCAASVRHRVKVRSLRHGVRPPAGSYPYLLCSFSRALAPAQLERVYQLSG
jgi:hypothetical protein